jgi:beta-glucosidase
VSARWILIPYTYFVSDRTSTVLSLPGAQDDLVKAVLAANPNTVVVTQTGMPVAMPWLDQAHTLVQSFYGGNEVGNGIADVLFGEVNPSGRLPVTFP